jgi:cardiolipin synthase
MAKVAFVGGHCVKDQWLGDAEDGKHFADVSVRVRGPVVANVQAAFSENWAGETGELFVGNDVFPPLRQGRRRDDTCGICEARTLGALR